jgi:tRNA pseudouridine38-40 synthase
VQGLLERALSRVAAEKVTLFGASRTDAGAHARQQVASFSLRASRAPAKAFMDGTNSMLPDDVRVTASSEMPLDFLASRDAVGKSYRYFLHVGEQPSVFLRHYAWHLGRRPDLDAMHAGAERLLGEHDFTSFRAARSSTKTSVRRVLSVSLAEERLDLVVFEISADGFLKHMVRAVTGTLVEIGLGKRRPEEMGEILAARDRRRAGRAAPACGLFLWDIRF